MTAQMRVIAVTAAAGVAMTGVVLAQGAGAPAPQGQAPAPAGQAQSPQPPTGGRGGQNPPTARRGGFGQFMRPLASQDVLLRGKALYDTNCAGCHAVDLRGTVDGENPNLLRSGIALRDQKGELVAAAVAAHRPTLTLIEADTIAVAEYIHSVHAAMGRAGRPPDSGGLDLNVLVGDASAGEVQFGALCGSCHSVTGDLRGIGAKFPDARSLQNGWVAGSASSFGRGGRFAAAAGGNAAVVTMPDGSTLEGTLVRKSEFLVILTLPDGTRKSMARNDGVPRVDVADPQEAHKTMALKLAFDDPDNSKLHDITAYLWTIK